MIMRRETRVLKRRRKTRSQQVTPRCDMMRGSVCVDGDGGGELTSKCLKGINLGATGGQRVTKWSVTAALVPHMKRLWCWRNKILLKLK